MADPEATAPARAVGPASRDGQAEGSRTSLARVGPARVRGSEPTAAIAPSGPTGAREFLAERLALFGRIAFLASTGFLLMRLVITASLKRSVLENFPIAHSTATAILLLVWILAGSRSFSDRGLRGLDAAGRSRPLWRTR